MELKQTGVLKKKSSYVGSSCTARVALHDGGITRLAQGL